MTPSPLAPKHFPNIPTIAGVELMTYACGIKYKDRDDMLVARFSNETQAAAVFTTSSTASANVLWGRTLLGHHMGSVLVVNAGNANAFNGQYGTDTIELITKECAALWKCRPEQVFPCATGVIGQPMPNDKILTSLRAMASNWKASNFEQAADAIKTTDTFAKGSYTKTTIGKTPVHIAGIAKGSGMIAPNMATMLGYIFTDAAIEGSVLQQLLAEAVETSFNAITVDSDTSTSDSLYLFATGKAGNSLITHADDPALASFKIALQELMVELAQLVVKDGEGATKFIQIDITGATDKLAARTIAMSIANSPLVKTAITGEDANWGRIMMAVGKAEQTICIPKISVAMGGTTIVKDGELNPNYREADVTQHMKGSNIHIAVDVGAVGQGKATVWTCNLTHVYIDINADYRS